MKKEREVIKKKAGEFTNADKYFEKHAGFPYDQVPAKYGEGVEQARKIIAEKLDIAIVFNCDEVVELGADSAKLACGEAFTGEMPPRILIDSGSVYNYIITLCGFTELKSEITDMMTEYFMDTWATAFVEAAQEWFGDYVKKELEKCGMKRTHIWSPGQHQFSLANQKPLFRMLKPEEVGCTLTKTLMMVPVKSVSGIIGVIPGDAGKQLLPCDFCSLSSRCPASKSGCAEL